MVKMQQNEGTRERILSSAEILFATGITLLLIPCGYLILEDLGDTLLAMRERIYPRKGKPA